jgi:ribosomal protein L40E
VAVAYQTNCDRCNAELVPNAAYCERCGLRTHRAKRLVRIAIRVEMLFVLLVIVMIFTFAYVFYNQK